MKIAEIFDEVALQMRSDFDQARFALQHPGLKGSALEEGFRQFLRKYLPKKLDISQGVIVDSQGNSSKQLDVIISDAHCTPIFFQSGDTRVIPSEMVYAVIEVKTKLDIAELNRCLDNMASVRALSKTSIQPGCSAPVTMYGRTFPLWPSNYYVFALDSAPLSSLSGHLCDYNNRHGLPPERRIDTICILNKGVILNQDQTGNVDALPSPGTVVGTIETKRALLLFYALTSRYWFQAVLPPFNVVPYLQCMNFGASEK